MRKIRDGGENPAASVIIPSLDGNRSGNLEFLLEDLASQSPGDFEILVVEGVRPNGRARNAGAAEASGRYLVFIDDDVRLGHPDVLANLLNALSTNRDLGLTGPSQLPPPDATLFQRAAARQLARSLFPVVDRLTDTDMVTHMCLAISAELWKEVGGEHHDLVRGTDPDLRDRVRRSGLRVAVAPATWAYHPPPQDLATLLRSSWRGGRGAAWVRRHHPGAAFDVPSGIFSGRAPVRGSWYRAARFFGRLAGETLGGRFLATASDIAYAAGYLSFLLERREPSIEELA